MTGKVEITHSYWSQMGPELRREADRLAGATAFSILGHARTAMAQPKHGKTYSRGNRTHTASAPGEAPAIDTGALSASGYAKQLQQGLWQVGFTSEYAPPLEYGTPRIEPRPSLRPAVEAHRDGFMAAIRRLVGR